MDKKNKIYSIQILRGIAALFVIFQHISFKSSQYDISDRSYFNIGFFGVDLFFIISGFIMCHTTASGRINPFTFIKNRAIRILPLYWSLTTLALAVFLARPDLVNSSGGSTDVFSSFTLIPTSEKLLINNGWTLSYEFLFYFIFFASLFLGKHAQNYFVYSVILTLISVGYIFNLNSIYSKFFTSTFLSEFLLGMIAYRFYISNKKPHLILYVLVFLSGASALIFQHIYGIFSVSLDRSLYAGVPMFMILISLVMLERNIYLADSTLLKPLIFSGTISYSMYLAHVFILSPASSLIVKATKNPIIFYAILFSATIASGYLCYTFVEVPLSKFFKKKPSQATGGEARDNI
ncbi:acyltransferase family protein [Erwinia sp. AnSW2-5]|uniref:acyltransferase family protein n=1 Tax=Erwinia sp. AnSW2-5 TaxID=3367692 RepID=UPI00385E8EB9